MASEADRRAGGEGGGRLGSDRRRGRTTGRRLALAAIFEADFGQRTAEAILERHLADTERDPVAADLARELVAAVVRNRVEIDALIDRTAPRHPVTSLAKMDRALLRSAIGEVLHSATPARVAIAEWVELARVYSGEAMRRLMNGVLGTISPTPSSEEGVSGHNVRPAQEDRRRAARRRRG
ncbi:MAG TPA: transcription antitermination factor NusB [Candidatus Limnocylindrales bacterium]|nr:transcription antitermination factor NusB [Candidatus Limnocylindrales bacterium]